MDRAPSPPPAARRPSRGGAAVPLRDRTGPAAGRRAPRGGGASRALPLVQGRAGRAPSLRLREPGGESCGLAGGLLRGVPPPPRPPPRVRLRDRAPAPLPGDRGTVPVARTAGGAGGPADRRRRSRGQERASHPPEGGAGSVREPRAQRERRAHARPQGGGGSRSRRETGDRRGRWCGARSESGAPRGREGERRFRGSRGEGPARRRDAGGHARARGLEGPGALRSGRAGRRRGARPRHGARSDADGARRDTCRRRRGPRPRRAMHLPAAWLTPGTYTAELRRLDAGPSSAEVFSFRVVP